MTTVSVIPQMTTAQTAAFDKLSKSDQIRVMSHLMGLDGTGRVHRVIKPEGLEDFKTQIKASVTAAVAKWKSLQ
jgi:hypothetical protein